MVTGELRFQLVRRARIVMLRKYIWITKRTPGSVTRSGYILGYISVPECVQVVSPGANASLEQAPCHEVAFKYGFEDQKYTLVLVYFGSILGIILGIILNIILDVT